MNASPVRVVLVDDHLSVVESFALLLQLDSDFAVSGVATSAEEGERLVLETNPDIAVFDVDFPGRDSFDLIPGLMAERPQTRIVILTAHLTDAFLSQALRMKVSGYILKSEPATSVRSALKLIHRGQTYFSSKAQECLIWDADKQAYEVKMESLLKGLSLLQLAILRHLARGESVKETAAALRLTEKSVDSHKYRIMNRLGIHDRVELCRYALREGLTLV